VPDESLCALEIAGKAGGISSSSFSVSDPSPSSAPCSIVTVGPASVSVDTAVAAASPEGEFDVKLLGSQLRIYAAMIQLNKYEDGSRVEW